MYGIKKHYNWLYGRSDIKGLCILSDDKNYTIVSFIFANGGMDDIKYRSDPDLQKYFPRGSYFVLRGIHNSETAKSQEPVKRILCLNKFTGISTNHDGDDEEIKEEAKLSFELPFGTTAILSTKKANGEFAHGTLVSVDGIKYVVSGSKTRARMFPLATKELNSVKTHEAGEIIYSDVIAEQFHHYVIKLSDNDRLNIIDKTFLGELEHPLSEHIFPIHTLTIQWFAMRDGYIFLPDPFNIFDKIGFSYVPSEEIKATNDTLTCHIKQIILDYGSEGSVIRALGDKRNMLEQYKVKGWFYTFYRRLREKLKTFLKKMTKGGIAPQQAVAELFKALAHQTTGVPGLTWLITQLPVSIPDTLSLFADLLLTVATAFCWWFLKQFFANKDETLLLFTQKYGTMWSQFGNKTSFMTLFHVLTNQLISRAWGDKNCLNMISYNDVVDKAKLFISVNKKEVGFRPVLLQRGKVIENPIVGFHNLLTTQLEGIQKDNAMRAFNTSNGVLGRFADTIDPEYKVSKQMNIYFPDWRNVKFENAILSDSIKSDQKVKTPKEDKVKKPKKKKPKKDTVNTNYVPPFIWLPFEEAKFDGNIKNIPHNTVIILRGPTGCGKTYFATNAGARHVDDNKNERISVVSSDNFFENIGRYVMSKINKAHEACKRNFCTSILRRDTVYVSNTNIKKRDFMFYLRVAFYMGYNVLIQHIDSFNLGLYKMRCADVAFQALETKLASTGRSDSWQGFPLKNVFKNHFNMVILNPNPFVECSTLLDAIRSPLDISVKKSFIYLTGSVIDTFKQKGINCLLKNGVSAKFITNCLIRDMGTCHITVATVTEYTENNFSAGTVDNFKDLCITPDDIVPVGVGKVTNETDTAYYVIISCDKLQKLRSKDGLPHKDFHITLGFDTRDVHCVSKGTETILYNF